MKTIFDLPDSVRFFFLYFLTQNPKASKVEALSYAIDRSVLAGRITNGQADSMHASVHAGRFDLNI